MAKLWRSPSIRPIGWLTLACVMAFCSSSKPMSRAASRSGLARIRTANFCEPKTRTCATPLIVESRWASWVSAYSLTCGSGRVGDERAMKKIGASAGLTLRNDGGLGSPGGSLRCAAAMADWTSCAAASMSRSSENCRVMLVAPCELVELSESSPAIVENCPSSGVATVAAMVSGDAPGRLAETEMVGKSTLGSSETGKAR